MSETRACPFCGKVTDTFILFHGTVVGCRYCGGVSLKQSNADRIRAMTDEELAALFEEYGNHNDVCPNFGAHACEESCRQCWLDYLKQEAGT